MTGLHGLVERCTPVPIARVDVATRREEKPHALPTTIRSSYVQTSVTPPSIARGIESRVCIRTAGQLRAHKVNIRVYQV